MGIDGTLGNEALSEEALYFFEPFCDGDTTLKSHCAVKKDMSLHFSILFFSMPSMIRPVPANGTSNK